MACKDVKDLDPRFEITAWWHTPTTHVYFSHIGDGLWEIAARAWDDPATHSAGKPRKIEKPLSDREDQQTTHRSNLASFVQQVRETLQIMDGSNDAGRSLKEVEQRLKDQLYSQSADVADPSG